MRTSVLVSSLFADLAVANAVVVKRQDLLISQYMELANAIEATGAPVGNAAPRSRNVYNPSAAASQAVQAITSAAPDAVATETAEAVTVSAKKNKRAVCTTRTFNGPQVTTPADTPAAFQSYAPFAAAANAAAQAKNIPSGYAVVPDFVNLNAAAQDPSYLTYVSSRLTAYDANQCASLCNTMKGCTAFNIYYERVPLVISSTTQVPDSNVCPATADSASATLIKCAFYGMPLLYTEATNVGQYQGKFQVVIAGSNAYVKSSAPSLDGYDGPVSFGNNSINAPAPVIDHGYLRVQTFGTNVPYDTSLCAASCAAQTAYNAQYGTFNGQACVFFNSYILYENGINGVFTCTYYGIPYGTSYATNNGQYDAQGNHFTVGSSYGYYLDGHYVE